VKKRVNTSFKLEGPIYAQNSIKLLKYSKIPGHICVCSYTVAW